jgi:hypothetical protein
MCDSNHGHRYKIVESGIWWEDGPSYVTYDFCSICFTVLHELWPEDTRLVRNRKVIAARFCEQRDSLDYLIKHDAGKYNKFTEHRNCYINYLFSHKI